ncbi:carbohydrate porin [Xanthomonas sp. NCPPB 1638]|uniref:carbohydrate porin n=1 Tax=Xanthomonas TaxID=338 RepID=UPI00132EAE10|nr:carbohydrate porin [Xanthomonas cucurbitae]QHG88077.1 porin [Xanthomonas cucurbitae]WDM74634.1 carbohydrate porin [Xanthomonas cucurbitae]
MKIRHTLAALPTLAASLLCAPAQAADAFDPGKHIGGDWGGARSALAEQGVEFKLAHFSQTAHNLSGGERETTAYADQFFLGGYFDLDRLWGWTGADFKLEITNRNGDLINTKAGIPTLLQAQQIFGRGPVTRLTQFSLTQRLLDDRLSLKAGRIYPSADFFALNCNFQHLSFCSGGSSNTISNNWYGDPLSAWGGVVTFSPDKRWFFRVGGYDANPQNRSTDQGLKLRTSGDDHGTLMVAEVEFKPDYGNGLDGDYRIGAVRNSNDQPRVYNQIGLPTSLSASPATLQDTDRAFYANVEQQLTSNGEGGGLRMFASIIDADDEVSTVGQVVALGAFWKGVFPARPNDRIGLAFGRNALSDRLRSAQRAYNQRLPSGAGAIDVQRYEYPIELNYNIPLSRGIEIMPSVQYIRHPGGRDVDHATLLGLQVSLNF